MIQPQPSEITKKEKRNPFDGIPELIGIILSLPIGLIFIYLNLFLIGTFLVIFGLTHLYKLIVIINK